MATAALLLAVALPAGARAEILEVYAIGNVAVDATAESAAEARELAIVQGRADAYRRMLERLTLEIDHPRLPPFDAALADRMITGFRVDSEKRSAVRYLGKLTYVFDPEAVREVLRNAGIPFADTVSKPFVVLPVLHEGGTARLWEDPNPWRDAWAEQPLNWGLVPFLLPLGDLTDMAEADAGAAVRGERERLEAMAARYGARAVLVAEARTGTGELEVVARSYGAEESGAVVASYTVPAAADPAAADPAAVYAEAIRAVVGQINEAWKTRNLVEVGEQGRLLALVRFADLGEWKEIRGRLRGVSSLRSTRTVSMARGVRQLELTYVGGVDQLALAMAQADLLLEPTAQVGPEQQAGGWPGAGAPDGGFGTGAPAAGPFGQAPTGAAWTIRLRGSEPAPPAEGAPRFGAAPEGASPPSGLNFDEGTAAQ